MLKKVLFTVFLVFLTASMTNSAFATLIFADGFESGSFSRWSGVVKTYGETAYVIYGGTGHHGLYGARFTSNGGGGYEKSYCYKNIPETSDIYARGYFYVSLSGMGDRFFFIVLKPVGTTGAAYIGLKRNPATGIVSWCFNCRHLTYYPQPDMYSSYLYPHAGHWYCVELHWKKGYGNGYAEAWINGVRIGWTGYRDTSYYGGINQVQFGLPQVYNCGPTTAYCDCAKIQNTYVGPEPSPLSFADGFESGSFSKWTGVIKTYGETASVVYGFRHHGLYSARFTSNGGASNWGTEYSYCYKTVASSAELYARGYFYVSKSGIVDQGGREFNLIAFRAGNQFVALAGWYSNEGEGQGPWNVWYLTIAFRGGYAFTMSASNPTVNRWYCVELHWKKDAANGMGELFVDGTRVCRITGYDTAYWGNANQVCFGLPLVYNCRSTTVYCDCAKIATSYIGREY